MWVEANVTAAMAQDFLLLNVLSRRVQIALKEILVEFSSFEFFGKFRNFLEVFGNFFK